MPLIRVRRAGQVTLPAAVSATLGLKEHDYLDVAVSAEGVIALRPVNVFVREPGWREKMAETRLARRRTNPSK